MTIDVDDVGEIFADFVFEAGRNPRLKLKRLVLVDDLERSIVEAITSRIESEC